MPPTSAGGAVTVDGIDASSDSRHDLQGQQIGETSYDMGQDTSQDPCTSRVCCDRCWMDTENKEGKSRKGRTGC